VESFFPFILGILGTEHFNKGGLSQVKEDLRLNLKEITRLNLFALKKPIKKRRAK